jgi:hypothetical protein
MNLAKNEPKRVAPQGPAPILPNWVLDGTAAMNLENAGFASGSAGSVAKFTLGSS